MDCCTQPHSCRCRVPVTLPIAVTLADIDTTETEIYCLFAHCLQSLYINISNRGLKGNERAIDSCHTAPHTIPPSPLSSFFFFLNDDLE